jgi:predicted RNase H-like nuclease
VRVVVAVGVDGCPKGWVAAALHDDRIVAVEHLPTIAAVLEVFPDATVVGIDIPIGLPDPGPREADVEAKTVLVHLASSVFLTPPRAVVEAPTHAEATKLAVELTGKGVSQQAYALRWKILEVDHWIRTGPGCDVREVHPEVSFASLIGDPAVLSKKRWGGMAERHKALWDAGLEPESVSELAGRLAAPDDVLDAIVAAWSAERYRTGEARSVPDRGANWDRHDPTIWA